MQHSHWKKEQLALIVFLSLSVITGLLTQFWAMSFLAWLSIFMLWKLVEFYQFYNWYMKGASKKDVPLNYGVWEELTCKVLDNKKRAQDTQKRNRYLIKQFSTTAQALPFATFLLNDEKEILWVNHIAEDILGIIESKDIGGKLDNIIRDPKLVDLLNAQKKDNQTKIVHPLDNDKSIHLRLILISKKRYLLIARDISEQESLQKSRRAFVANASHELRTPLTVINGYLEMLSSAENLPEQWYNSIQQAELQAVRMGRIINDMLKLSSIEHEKFSQPTNNLIDMPLLLNSLYNDVRNGSDASQHQFVAEIDSTLRITGDHSEITSIGLNLLRNAIIHTPAATEITLKWFENHGRAHLHICDNGPGIEAKHLPHLTERFYRVDNSRAKNLQSTGLGLAIVKHICINHSAEFEIDSKIEEGSCFKIIFPENRTFKHDESPDDKNLVLE